jgi:hypothetical protein
MDIPPNQTVYVNNLFEKLPKEGEHVMGHATPQAA